MKTTTKSILGTLVCLFCIVNASLAQNAKVAINVEYAFMSGLPAYHDFVSSAVDSEMNLIVAGNITTTAQGANVHVSKYDRNGVFLWENTWNSNQNNGDDYAVQVIIGENKHIYVAGATYNATQDANDMVILKYSPAGLLMWERVYNGASGGEDMPADLTYDGNASVYVTGATEGATTLSDLALLRLNSASGNVNWAVAVDNSGFYDGGASVSFGNNAAYVVGGSGTAWNNWNILTIRFDSLGQQQGSSTANGSALGFNKPEAIGKDSNGNIIVAGSVANTGTLLDMKVVKMDPDLNVIWSENFDYFNADDGIMDLDIDNADNVYLAGYGTDGANRKFGVLKKLDSDGDVLWERHQKSAFSAGNVQGIKVALSANGQVAMSCNVSSASNQGVQTFGYSTDGITYWMSPYEKDEGDDAVHSLVADEQNNFYVNGTTYDVNLNKKYFSQKLATLKVPIVVVNDTNGDPHYLNHQVIAAFRPSLVDAAFVGNKDKTFIVLDDLIPASLLSSLSAAWGQDLSKKIYAEKIFKKLTPADTISISRNGYEVRIPAFYSRMLLHLPVGYNTANFEALCSAMFPDIQYAQLNYLGTLGSETSDTYIDEQASLIPTLLYPNGSINLGPVWDENIVGDPMTKVGVYDDVIDWGHPDFGDGTLEGSKVAGGFDYVNNMPLSSSSEGGPHGTAVAGIIGALRDNGTGIAGVAGGDGGANTGASLYSFGTSYNLNNESVVLSVMSEAFVDGAMDTPIGLHIANHSWEVQSQGEPIPDLPLLREATLFSFNNEVAIVAIRGNSGNTTAPSPIAGPVAYPAGFEDSWVMSIGGSGHDGSYKRRTDNGDPGWEPSFNNVDFIAPSASCLIYTTSTDDLVLGGNSYSCIENTGTYGNFGGTSAAAPHVSGVAALMHAHHHTDNGYPNNLAPEDYENILKISAVDINSNNALYSGFNYPVGPDDFNGHGRIDAAKAIEIITMPDYRVQHLDILSTSYSTNFISGEQATLLYDINGLEAGTYFVEEFNISYPFNVTYGSTDMIDAVWKRESSSISYGNLFALGGDIEPWNQFDVDYQINGNNISGTITSSCYKVFPISGNSTVFEFIPAPPDQLRANLSIHIRFSETVSNSDAEKDEFKLFPNPSTGEVNIKSVSPIFADISVFSLSGNLVKSYVALDFSESQRIDLNDFSNGIYFIAIRTSEGISHHYKFIKL